MIFKLLDEKDKNVYREEIISMMKVSDKDFVPPLSARSSTLQKDLKVVFSTSDGIYKYFEEMVKQEILCAFDGENLLGFVSFKKDYVNDVIKENYLPNVYLSTLILKPEARGKRLTQSMYDYLFNTLYKGINVFTRTWSTNIAHIKILSKFNFVELSRKPNDRGDGIDTVYYALIRM